MHLKQKGKQNPSNALKLENNLHVQHFLTALKMWLEGVFFLLLDVSGSRAVAEHTEVKPSEFIFYS